MNRFDQDWQRLVALARQVPRDEDAAVPPGFATRVAALAAAPTSPASWAGLERLALRGFVAATACCAAAVAYSYFGRSPDLAEDAGIDDTVSEILDLS